MNIRRIAAAAAFATGATLAFAPLAAAVPDPTLVTDTLDSEISSLNSGFELDALFAGDSADITKATTPGAFDTFTSTTTLTKTPRTWLPAPPATVRSRPWRPSCTGRTHLGGHLVGHRAVQRVQRRAG